MPRTRIRRRRSAIVGKADVEQWFERDRANITLYLENEAGRRVEVASWWDEDVYALVEGGFFEARGLPYRQEPIDPSSVTEYAVHLGLMESVDRDDSISGTFRILIP